MRKFFDLQMFAKDANGAAQATEGNTNTETQPAENNAPAAKYTDEDVDKILNRKFAEMQARFEKEAAKKNEAARLASMSAEEKAAERMKALEDKIKEYETNAARTEMTKQARAILQDKGINVNDTLLANLIAEDAEATKASCDNFITLFNAEVDKRVKAVVGGETPRTGAPAKITKEQIMAIKNTAERQRLINENLNLFTK